MAQLPHQTEKENKNLVQSVAYVVDVGIESKEKLVCGCPRPNTVVSHSLDNDLDVVSTFTSMGFIRLSARCQPLKVSQEDVSPH